MATPAHFIGAKKTLTGSFTDITGTPADPTAIVLTIREPDGALIVKAIGDLTNTGVGVYTFDHLIAKVGRHIISWVGSAGIQAAFEQEFYARRIEAQ